MNAFAAGENSTTISTISSDSQTKDFATYVNGEEAFDNVYNSKQTWNISITGDELCWTIVRSGTRTHNLTWDGTQYTDASSESDISYRWKDSSEKTIALINSSNFDVATVATHTNTTTTDEGSKTYPSAFSVSNNISTMTSSNTTATVAVTPSSQLTPEEFAELYAVDKHQVGQVTLTFSKSGGLYSYGVNAVTDTTTP